MREINRVKEAELYRTAASLFNKNGYTGTSMRQICKSIGIRESSLYHYIRGKEDLLYHICEWSMYHSLTAIEPIAQLPLRPDLKLKKMIEKHIIILIQNANEHATMLKEMRSLSVPKRRKIIRLRDQYKSIFREVIEAGFQQKLFNAVDIKVMTFALLGMMNSIIRWYSVDGETKIEDIAAIFSDLFLKGARR